MIKCGAHILFALMVLLSSISQVCSAEVSRDKLESIEQKAHLTEIELKKKQAEAVALSLELAKLNKQMTKAAKQIQIDENKTTKMESELELLEKKLQVSEEQFSIEYKNLAQILLSMQNLALYPSETLIVHPLSPVEIIQSAILMRESVPYIKENANKIKKDIEDINAQKKRVKEALKKVESQRSLLMNQQKKIQQMLEKKNSIRKKIEGESTELKLQADKLASEAANLKELVEKLEKDEELNRRRKEEIKKAAKRREQEAFIKLQEEQKKRIKEGKTKGLSYQNGRLYEGNNEEELENIKPQISNYATDFASAKGRLSRPVTGDIITSYGNELSKGVTSKGIVIKTRPQAQVIAPYDGSVIFSGPFKGYGNLIIIDHEKGYISLLAGLDVSDTQTGQTLLAGEPVGIMPNSDTAKLYMEIRKDQNPINPEPWLEK